MSTDHGFLKKAVLQASLIGAFGGMAPKLIEMIPRLFANVYPSSGQLLALVILAFIGGVIVLVYKEENLQKALILGAGAPAIIATLTAQAVAPTSGLLLPVNVSFASTAFAQTKAADSVARFVFTQNESPYKLNALWIRADATTIEQYKIVGDTVVVSVPPAAKEIRIDLPAQGKGFVLSASELVKSNTMRLKIINNRQTKDFWETFGNAKVAEYRIVRVDQP